MRLTVSQSPHEKAPYTVSKVMWGVMLALVPAFISSVYFFGVRALVVTLVAIVAAIATEYLTQKFLMKSEITAFDGSAAVTGILLAFNLPSSIPMWQVIVGTVFAIGVGKMAFGGLGRNPFNPALVGRAFLLMSFPVDMTTWPKPAELLTKMWLWVDVSVDATTGATPLGVVKEGLKAGESAATVMSQIPDYFNLLIGNVGGSLGETSAVAILLGAIFLLYKRMITWHIPVFYIGSLAFLTGIFWLIDPTHYADPLFHILAGGVMLGAFFMATDMVTSPMTVKGQIIFAIGGGLIAGLIRLFGAYPEGCMFSILIMNALVPLIDKFVKPKRFGKEVNYG
ncbi:RnfABCDGE type electron transport complex subunit D [bacterium]|nr:RnfABCDGE type electron transport complex subunit D [bacterium]